MFRPVGAGHLIKWIHFFSTLRRIARASLLSGVSVMKARTLIFMSSAPWFGRVKCRPIGVTFSKGYLLPSSMAVLATLIL